MRWGSFIFGLILLLLGLSGGIVLIIFLGLPALILLVYGLGESDSEKSQKIFELNSYESQKEQNKIQKEQLDEIKKLREEVKELKKADNVK